MPKKNRQLQPRRQNDFGAVRVFPKRARTCILVACALAAICFILLPLGLNQLDSANIHAAFALTEPAPAQTPTPSPEVLSAAAALQDETPVPEPSDEVRVYDYSLLQLNDDYPAVETLQLRLMELGYLDSDEPGTVYNDATQAAVAMFQRTLNTDTNGVADSELQTVLYSAEASTYESRLGDAGSDIKALQTLLNDLGYYTGKINGYFGTATEEALKAFQKKNGLEQDGVFNVDDRDLIYSPDARPAIDPTPTPKPTAKPTAKPTKKPSSTPKPSTGGSTTVVSPTDPPQTEPDPTERPAEEDYPTGGEFSASGDVSGVISVAEAQIGKRYVSGDEGPNTFDCSGLVYYCLKQNGVSVSRCSAASFCKIEKWTLISSMSDLQRGDLLFFRNDDSSRVSHVGIYIGGGKMIDASSSNGKVVKRSATSAYWTRNFVCARRVF